MAKKEKIVIQRDQNMEPIDNELDEAMGLLEAANRQITDLLTSLETSPTGEIPTGAAELDDPLADGKPAADGETTPPEVAGPKDEKSEEKAPDSAS